MTQVLAHSLTPMLAFDVEVTAVTVLTPHFTRVTFAGPRLACFADGGQQGTRDLRVKLLFPPAGRPAPDLGDLSAGWYQRWLTLDADQRGALRTYTVRQLRSHGSNPEVDVDFVVHPAADAGSLGPAARWLSQARPGQRLTLLGPNAGYPHGERLPGVEWLHPAPGGAAPRVLLAGDETAVPAVASILATLPSRAWGHALLEVPAALDFLDLPTAAHVEVVWSARGDRPRGELLGASVRRVLNDGRLRTRERPDDLPDVDVDAEILWETAQSPHDGVQVWLAGEAAMVRDLRRYLVGECGLDRRAVSFMGYWRHGRAEAT